MESRVQPSTPASREAQAPAEGACGLTPAERKSVIDALLQEIDKTQKWTRLVAEMQAEIARLRLTDAEREAVARSAAAWDADAKMGLSDGGVAATLRGLLERMNHDAAPAATAVSDEDRTDKAATSHRRDRPGDTPVFDRSKPINDARSVASAGSVASEPTGWAVVNRHGTAVRFSGSFLTLATAATQADEIVPLYRAPTLTDAEREAVEAAQKLLTFDGYFQIADTLRGLLERLGVTEPPPKRNPA